MRLRMARAHASGGGAAPPHGILDLDEVYSGAHGTRRRVALAVAVVLLLGAVGTLISPGKPASAATVFQSGQVFASVGNSTVNVYDPTSGDQVTSLNDGLNEPYTAGSVFDASGNFYVADDLSGDVSEYSPNGTLDGTFASGLTNPLSLVFDNQGNLYVGQQGTPYIAEFNASGQNVANYGPLTTQESGDDWIDLASDECTFYYTTEGNEIFKYNKCTNTQEGTFNQQPLTGDDAFDLKILPDGDVLVADSETVDLLDPNGNLVQTYSCSGLPNCGGSSSPSPWTPTGHPSGPPMPLLATSTRSISPPASCCRPSARVRPSSSVSPWPTRSRWPRLRRPRRPRRRP